MRTVEPSGRLTAVATASAALVPGATETVHGAVAPLDDLPRNMRRRLSSFDRMVARCVLGLKDETAQDEPIVFASNYGNMQLTLDLLNQLCEGESMSPAAFSASVHNAAVGFASLLTRNHGGHVAVSAGGDSLRAGFLEACLRLSEGDGGVLLVAADEPLPGVYAGFDPEAESPAVSLAMRLVPAKEVQDADPVEIDQYVGRTGLVQLAGRLASGPCVLSCSR